MIKTLRTIHSWIGIFVMPWIIVIGLTGLYLNHSKVINKILDGPGYDESLFDASPEKRVSDETSARELANRIWGIKYSGNIKQDEYHNRAAFIVKVSGTKLIIAKETGNYWIKSRFIRKTYSPDGELIHTRIYWAKIFNYLHTDGWIGGGLGSWLADITAGAMVLFGLSGMILFISPCIRRLRRGRQQISGVTRCGLY